MGVRYEMTHPKQWTDQTVVEFLNDEGFDSFRLQRARPAAGSSSSSSLERLVFFQDEAIRSTLGLQKSIKNVVFKLKLSFSDPDAWSLVILLRLPGPEAQEQHDKVKDMVEDMGTAERRFPFLASTGTGTSKSEASAWSELLSQTFPWTQRKFMAYNLDIRLNMVEGFLLARGNPKMLHEAETEIQSHLSKLQVKSLPFVAPKARGSSSAVSSQGRTWRPWLEATLETIKACLSTRLDRRNRVGFAVDEATATIALSWWKEEDEDRGILLILAELEQKLESFCHHYQEAVWKVANGAKRTSTIDIDIEQLCKDSGVALPVWDASLGVLNLYGHEESIATAKSMMDKLYQPSKQVQLLVGLPVGLPHLKTLLDHPNNQEQLRNFRKTHLGIDVLVSLESEKPISIRGEESLAKKVQANVQSWLEKLHLVPTMVPLDWMQLSFLESSDGKDMLEKIFRSTAAFASIMPWQPPAQPLPQQRPWPEQSGQSKPLLARATLSKGVMLEVWHGDIVANEAKVTSLVSSADGHLLLGKRTGVAEAIQAAAGPDLVDACSQYVQTHGPAKMCSVLRSDAFQLKSKGFETILHTVTPRSVQGQQAMRDTMCNILRAAVEAKATSIAVPLLGTGAYSWKLDVVAPLLLSTITAWVGSGEDVGGLRRIVITDLSLEKCQRFTTELKQRLGADPAPAPAPTATPLPTRLLKFAGLRDEHSRRAETALKDELKRAEWKHVERCLLPRVTEDVEKLRQSFLASVAAHCSTHKLPDIPLKVEMARTGVADSVLSVSLTSLGNSNLSLCKVLLGVWMGERLRRTLTKQAKVEYPVEWNQVGDDDDDEDAFRLELVQRGSVEFNNVVNLMSHETGMAGDAGRKNIFSKTILEVQRVVNRPVWRKYYWFRRNLKLQNEVWTKHGTTSTQAICESGFDRGRSRPGTKNMWGVAVYTAESAAYSDLYTKGAEGSRQMLLCKFAAGNVYSPDPRNYNNIENRKLKEAPTGYDSIRGCTGRSLDFAMISYQDNQVYPFYVVTYQ
mmetsp:Transcript_91205/g.199770  ORF Transcript_91205/g.199770 Transcript_91205/m.199770 type:complete len:1022 (-) Transcript_91205:216-3281(-)